MWDSIFILINHINKPYKKKDLRYLINSRLKNPKKRNLIISQDIKVADKCSTCKEFQPWIILKNCGEGIFLLKKFIEKYEPWVTMAIQENIYNLSDDIYENFDSIFALINKLNSRKKLYELIKRNSEIIINSDIRIKNECFECNNIYPWIIIKNEKKGIELARQLNSIFAPFITLKKQKIIYKHNIPKEIGGFKTWTKNMELRYGKLIIEI